MLNEGFTLEILKTIASLPLLLFAVVMTYYILAFVPAYLFQLFLQKYNFINFFSIIVSAIILITLILSLIGLEFAPIETIIFFSYFSVTFAITYWILLLKTLKKNQKNLKTKISLRSARKPLLQGAKMPFNFLKIFIQNLDPDKDQIWHCLIMTPIYLYIVTLFIFLTSSIIHKDFSFQNLLNTPVILLTIAAIYQTSCVSQNLNSLKLHFIRFQPVQKLGKRYFRKRSITYQFLYLLIFYNYSY